MDRRDFLKGVLGGVAVVATPQIALKAEEISKGGIIVPVKTEPEIITVESAKGFVPFPFPIISWSLRNSVDEDLNLWINRPSLRFNSLEMLAVRFYADSEAPLPDTGDTVKYELPIDVSYSDKYRGMRVMGLVREYRVDAEIRDFVQGHMEIRVFNRTWV